MSKKKLFILVSTDLVVTTLVMGGLAYLFVAVTQDFPSFGAFLKQTGGAIPFALIAIGLFIFLIFSRFFCDDDYNLPGY